jgi:PadR family transcriptional regulator PadR
VTRASGTDRTPDRLLPWCRPAMARTPAGPGPVVLRTALLVLLAEGDSHGYGLARRLAEVGVARDLPAVYRTLRLMDHRGELRSAWDASSSRGPVRRIYGLTDAGRSLLQRELAGIEEHSVTLARLLTRSGWPAPATPTAAPEG